MGKVDHTVKEIGAFYLSDDVIRFESTTRQMIVRKTDVASAPWQTVELKGDQVREWNFVTLGEALEFALA